MTVAPRENGTGVTASTAPPEPRAAAEPVEPVTVVEPVAAAVEPVTVVEPAPAQRKAFWFELMPAAEPGDDDEAPADPTPEVQPAAAVEAAPVVDPEPVVAAGPATTPRNHWLTVLCLLALVGLVVALTGRNPRR
jgi:hypothetical protein